MVEDVPGVHHGMKIVSTASKPLRRTLSQQAADQPVIRWIQMVNRAIGSK